MSLTSIRYLPRPAVTRASRPPRREPLHTIEPGDAARNMTLAGTRVSFCECAKCGKAVLETAVVNDPVEKWKGDFVVRRRLYCDHCDHVQFWFQHAAADGALYSGPPIDGPGFLPKASIVNAFLRRHPHAAGVAQ